MGDEAERLHDFYYIYTLFDDDDDYTLLDPYEWRTADGDFISMRDMSTTHLMNCIGVCERMENHQKKLELETVLQERARQGP